MDRVGGSKGNVFGAAVDLHAPRDPEKVITWSHGQSVERCGYRLFGCEPAIGV